MIGLSIYHKTRVLNPVRVSTRHAPKMRMLSVNPVIGSIVETTDDVTFDAGSVVYEEVGDRGAIGDEVCADPGADELVFTV